MSGTTVHKDQWLDLMDQLKIGAFTVDTSMHVIAYNRTVESMLGLRESESLGRSCQRVFCGDWCDAACPCRNAKSTSPKVFDIELQDHEAYTHLITRLAAPIYDGTNSLVGQRVF